MSYYASWNDNKTYNMSCYGSCRGSCNDNTIHKKNRIKIKGNTILIEKNIQPSNDYLYGMELSNNGIEKKIHPSVEYLYGEEIPNGNNSYMLKWLKDTYNYSPTGKIIKTYYIKDEIVKYFHILDDKTTILLYCGGWGVAYTHAEFSTLK